MLQDSISGSLGSGMSIVDRDRTIPLDFFAFAVEELPSSGIVEPGVRDVEHSMLALDRHARSLAYTLVMKPRDLNEGNWDVNVAVFEVPELEARIWFSGTNIGFMVSTGLSRADITIPIKDFRKAVTFVDSFDVSTLDPKQSSGARLGTWTVEVVGHCGSIKGGKTVYRKMPYTVVLRPWKQRADCLLVLRLSLFKKLIRWYNSDVK